MTPKQVNLKLSAYDLAIEAAKMRTCAEIKERMAVTGCSMATAMTHVLKAHKKTSFRDIWAHEAEAAIRRQAA